MPSYSGVWTLTAQYQAIGGQNWPMAPGAPTSVSATAGDTEATVTFVAPTFVGIPPPITEYKAIASPGGSTVTGASSPLTVTGLSNGTAYTIAVQATNAVGYGRAGTSGSFTPIVAARGLFSGMQNSSAISYITISTLGNSSDFGDLLQNAGPTGNCASTTRALFMGGSVGGTDINVIQYVTIANTGNSTDFGDLIQPMGFNAAFNSNTLGVTAGGYGGSFINNIEFVTIATLGNASDFGDLIQPIDMLMGCSSPTRGIFAGGNNGSSENVIQYVTIASAGNATDFGDLSSGSRLGAGCSTNIYGVLAIGRNNNGGTSVNVINYITIANTGNSTDFGDLTAARQALGACSSTTRGCFGGGNFNDVTYYNIIDYVTIASAGNAIDFGDIVFGTIYTTGVCGTSSGNGGLS
jgi:hypothetical protein